MEQLNRGNVISSRYYNTPPINGYLVDEEYNYILPERDDVTSIILLEIVTRFGSPGNDLIKKKTNLGKYQKVKITDNFEDCPICLESFKLNQFYRKLECNHVFHKKCIDRWFKKDNLNCPMCRHPC